jgi:putative restriction endonuclease
MNSLQRTLVAKTAYDHGWEIIEERPAEGSVHLTSAHHRAEATVNRAEPDAGWNVQFHQSRLCKELRQTAGIQSTGNGGFLAHDERALGYLLAQAARLARTLPDLPCLQYESAVSQALKALTGPTAATEVERTVRQRVGQQVYRQSLMDYWGGACAVTGLAIPELLRASHAVPWADCTSDADRLNVFNGFLLAAHLDALFDRHLMTFHSSGEILLAPVVTEEARALLNLTVDLRLRWLSPAHLPFLAEHRNSFHALHRESSSPRFR